LKTGTTIESKFYSPDPSEFSTFEEFIAVQKNSCLVGRGEINPLSVLAAFIRSENYPLEPPGRTIQNNNELHGFFHRS
jgi:hypothetical protein